MVAFTEPAEGLNVVEHLRRDLEESLTQLRASLRHWQLWEAEYEGLREELERLPAQSETCDVLAVVQNFGGDLVAEAEIKELITHDHGRCRSRKEIVHRLTGRVDTSQKNIAAVQKRIDATNFRLQALDESLDPGNEGNNAPIMEIQEEIDDHGNMIASQVVNADESIQQLDNAFRTAAAHDTEGSQNSQKQDDTALHEENAHEIREHTNNVGSSTQDARAADHPRAVAAITHSIPTHSSHVTFKTQPIRTAHSIKNEAQSDSYPDDQNNRRSEEFLELDENDQVVGTRAGVHLIQSPEERMLQQREMLENARAIGPIVATMDIEDGSDFSDDYDYGDYSSDDSATAEETNAFGSTSTRSVMTPEYIAEMEALMKKYQPIMSNSGPREAGFPVASPTNKLPTPSSEISPLDPTVEVSPTPVNVTKQSLKKGVRFADELEVASVSNASAAGCPTTISTQLASSPAIQPKLPPQHATLADVLERKSTASTHTGASTSDQVRKISRFKAARLEGL